MKTKIVEKLKRLKPIHYVLIFVGIVIYAGIIIGVVNYRANREVNPPRLDVLTPVAMDTYSSENILVEGFTEPRGKVVVQGQEVKADKDGKYSATVPLAVGENSIKISATKNDLTSEKVIDVTRVVPQEVEDPTIVTPAPDKLNESGPETLWVFEAGSLAAAAAAYQVSKRRLQSVLKG